MWMEWIVCYPFLSKLEETKRYIVFSDDAYEYCYFLGLGNVKSCSWSLQVVELD